MHVDLPAPNCDNVLCSVVLVAAVERGSLALAAFRARPPLTMSLSSLKRAVASIFEPRAVETEKTQRSLMTVSKTNVKKIFVEMIRHSIET